MARTAHKPTTIPESFIELDEAIARLETAIRLAEECRFAGIAAAAKADLASAYLIRSMVTHVAA
jgi:hypothetical protein